MRYEVGLNEIGIAHPMRMHARPKGSEGRDTRSIRR